MKKYNRREFIGITGIASASFFLNPAFANSGFPAEPVRTGMFPFYKYAGLYNAWEFIPMDQGGRLVQLELLGTEVDTEIVRTVRDPEFFKIWGDPIKWDALEKTEVEKSVWLNRWYFLNSYAHCYYKTGDKKYLQEILSFIRRWREENPLPTDLKAYFAARHYNWRDMQVAWRMQNLCWIYFLGKNGFSKKEKLELYELIKTHAAALIAFFGDHPLIENNHQSHGATTMLYAALLFPDLPQAEALKNRAIEILNHHLEHAFFDDGNSIELCPGYYPFFVSIFRDAWMLCKANNTAPPTRCRERLEQFYQYLNAVKQPDGNMPPINDSTESKAGPSIQVLQEILGLSAAGLSASRHFSSSHQAVMRHTGSQVPSYVFLDAGQPMLAHWHTGKLGFHLWFWDKAFLVDSGICNYDNPLRRSWYWKPEAHNTLLVDGKGDYSKDKRESMGVPAACSIQQWESNSRYDWTLMRHDGFDGLTWFRHFVNVKGVAAFVVDEIESKESHEYTWLYHLLPCSPQVNETQKSVFTAFADKNLLIQPAQADSITSLGLEKGWINQRGKNVEAPVARYSAKGKDLAAAFLLLPVEKGGAEGVNFTQKSSGNSIELALKTGSASVNINLARSADRRYRLEIEE